MSDETRDTRLPPPVFPPGHRKHFRTNSSHPDRAAPGSGASEAEGDAFISPDEPIPPRPDALDEALISPNEALPERPPKAVFDAFISPDHPTPDRGPEGEEEEGVATGMGHDPHLDPGELVAGGDPHVIEVSGALERLAAAMKAKGEAGLKATTQMSRFEATLRAYCVGYIAGRRAEDMAEEREYAPYTGLDSEG
jgi:hypothetical protein